MKDDKSVMIPIMIIMLLVGYIFCQLYYDEKKYETQTKKQLFGKTEQLKKGERGNAIKPPLWYKKRLKTPLKKQKGAMK